MFLLFYFQNFNAHLPTLLKRGLSADRPDEDIAVQMRKRYKVIEQTKRKASGELSKINPELAAELEEIADDLRDTHEKVDSFFHYIPIIQPSFTCFSFLSLLPQH